MDGIIKKKISNQEELNDLVLKITFGELFDVAKKNWEDTMNKTIKENDSLDISKFSTSSSPTELIWKDSDSIIIQYLTKTDVNGEIFLRKVFSSFTFFGK